MNFQKLAKSQQLQQALPILLAARRAVVLGGDAIDAIQRAGNASLACHFARRLLLSVTSSVSLQAWQMDRAVKQSDRTRAFDRAIRLARAAFGHRGGWVVADTAGAP